MLKYQHNYFSNNTRDIFNKSTPKTPCGKKSRLKEENSKENSKLKNNLIKKDKMAKNNNKKNYKLYSSSILNKKNNIENRKLNYKSKYVISYSKSREPKNCFTGKSNYYNEKNINLNITKYKKKNDYLFLFENKTKKIKNKQEEETNHENQNKINKTQSFVNNSNLSYNSFNYISNTVKNAINSSVKKTETKAKSRPTSLLLDKKLKEEKRYQNKAKPMTLLESSKDKTEKLNCQTNNKKIASKKNFQINTNNINYVSDNKIINSNYFLKNNIFLNKTCNNELYTNNLTHSGKNQTPIIIKEKIFKYNKKNKDKEIKKSQSQSHIFYQKSQYKKTENIFRINIDTKIGKKNNNLSTKKTIRNKATNFNLNINNINNFNNKYLFNCNNLNKSSSSSTTKTRFVNVKYPYEINKKFILYDETNNNKYDLINILNNLPEEYTKNDLFIKITNLWNELGGVNNSYIQSFIKNSINKEDKNIIFQNEINELTLILNILHNLNENIKKRNDILEKIKFFPNIQNNLNEIENLLTILTNITINIVNEYNTFLKSISFDILMNKYSIDRINDFDINYLSQMESDSNFILDIPGLNKILKYKKNYPFFISTEDIRKNNQIDMSKYILFKNKIYQDLINEEENNLNNRNNINLNIENLFPNNINNNTNRSENNISIINKKTNKYNITKQNNNFIEKTVDIIITPNKTEENKKEKEIHRNEIICNNTKFNLFTFGHQSKLPKIKDETILKITPYNSKKDPKLILLYTSYLSFIEEKMKLSFNINSDIYFYSNLGIYPKILLFKDYKSNVKAICTSSYEQNIYSDKKILNITSISCMEGYKISKILINLIEYFKNNEIYFDTIEINLYYIIKNGKFVLDEEYEREIKNEAKFRWVKLENDGEKRKIKYHYVNKNIIINKENSINNNNIIPNNNQTIIGVSIINYSLIKYYQKFGYENLMFSEHNQLYPIINLLKKYYLLNDSNKNLNQVMDNFIGIKLKKIIRIISDFSHILATNSKDFKNDFCNEENFNIELLYQFLDIIEKNKNEEQDDLFCVNCFNIFTNFSSIIKVELNGYEYNLISTNDYVIEAFNINNDIDDYNNENYTNFNIYDNVENNNNNEDIKENEILYFIKSENDNISFIIYELNENKEDLNQQEIHLLFNKILEKILVKDNEEPIKSYKKICIPSFHYKKRSTDNDNYEDISENKLKLIEYDLLDYIEEINFCQENLNDNDIKFSFPLMKKIEDIKDIKIIKNNFVIAVLNPDLILDYHLPAMNIFYISKENMIKVGI